MKAFPWTNISLFAGLTAEEIETIKPIFSTIETPAREYVLREGESGDAMYILIKGRVRITKAMIVKGMSLPIVELEDPRKVLATLDEASFPIFGEMALLDKDVRSASVETLVPCTFFMTTQERFFELIEKQPRLGCHLLVALGRRLTGNIRRSNKELIKLTTALALALSQQR